MLRIALKRKRGEGRDHVHHLPDKQEEESATDVSSDGTASKTASADAYKKLLQLTSSSCHQHPLRAVVEDGAAGLAHVRSIPATLGHADVPPNARFASEVIASGHEVHHNQEAAESHDEPLDFYRRHFDKELSSEEKSNCSRKGSLRLNRVETVGWQPSQIRRHSQIQASCARGPVSAPVRLKEYGIKARLQGTFALLHGQDVEQEDVEFPARSQAAAFALCNQYLDILHVCHPYAKSADSLSSEESATLLHAVNHISKKMELVKKNNQRLATVSLDKSDTRDQGFVRPIVLLLAPMRSIALTIALRFAFLAQRENRADSIQGKDRLLKEFCAAAGVAMNKDVTRPVEHKALFSGTNTDDHFRIGIKVSRGAVR
eukprot:jgi/Ulvmu1/11998/UM083_0009.1